MRPSPDVRDDLCKNCKHTQKAQDKLILLGQTSNASGQKMISDCFGCRQQLLGRDIVWQDRGAHRLKWSLHCSLMLSHTPPWNCTSRLCGPWKHAKHQRWNTKERLTSNGLQKLNKGLLSLQVRSLIYCNSSSFSTSIWFPWIPI